MEDKTLKCADCGVDFVFTVREQEFYAEKGFNNEPKRCPDCRRKRKAERRNNNNDRRW
jgi:DNA-directed RNA polymerase subunit RPC12/RpoP